VRDADTAVLGGLSVRCSGRRSAVDHQKKIQIQLRTNLPPIQTQRSTDRHMSISFDSWVSSAGDLTPAMLAG